MFTEAELTYVAVSGELLKDNRSRRIYFPVRRRAHNTVAHKGGGRSAVLVDIGCRLSGHVLVHGCRRGSHYDTQLPRGIGRGPLLASRPSRRSRSEDLSSIMRENGPDLG